MGWGMRVKGLKIKPEKKGFHWIEIPFNWPEFAIDKGKDNH